MAICDSFFVKRMKDFRIFVFFIMAYGGVPTVAFAANPVGSLDGINQNGEAGGWGQDPDSPEQSIAVEFYVDGPKGEGTFIGRTTADISRADVSRATGTSGNHGFLWRLPTDYRGAP